MRRPNNLQWIACAALLAAILVLVWQVVEKNTAPDATTLALLLVVVAAFAALLDPLPFRNLARRITAFEGFGVKVGLEVERARDVNARFPASDDGVKVIARERHPGDPEREVRDVVRAMRARLRFVVKAVLGVDDLVIEPRPDLKELVTEQPLVARLESVGLLDRQEAKLTHELLGDLGQGLPSWDEVDRAPFLDNAWNFTGRLTTGLFDRWARKRLKENGWFVGDFEQAKGHRPDFVTVKDNQWARIAARVADPPDSKSMNQTLDRLVTAKASGDPPRPVIVVPDHVDGLRVEISNGPVMLAGGNVIALRLNALLNNPELLAPENPGPSVGSLAPPGAQVADVEYPVLEEEQEEPEPAETPIPVEDERQDPEPPAVA